MKNRVFLRLESSGYRIISIEKTKEGNNVLYDEFFPSDLIFDDDKLRNLSIEIATNIKNLESKSDIKIKKICVLGQTRDLLYKKIDTASKLKQKDVYNIIETEFSDYGYFDSNNYEKMYYYSEDIENSAKYLSSFLCPQYILKLAKYIEKFGRLYVEKYYLDFQIIQLIYLERFSDYRDCIILEFRNKDIVLCVMKNGTLVNTMVVGDELNESLMKFISEQGEILIFKNDKNALYDEFLNSEIKISVQPDEYEVFEYIIKKENNGIIGYINFSQKEKVNGDKPINILDKIKSESEVYGLVLKLCLVVIIMTIISAIFTMLDNKNLEMEYLNTKSEPKAKIYVSPKRVKGYRYIYGKDAVLFINMLKSTDGKTVNASLEENFELEFIVDDRKQLNRILSNKMFKNARIEYIRSDNSAMSSFASNQDENNSVNQTVNKTEENINIEGNNTDNNVVKNEKSENNKGNNKGKNTNSKINNKVSQSNKIKSVESSNKKFVVKIVIDKIGENR